MKKKTILIAGAVVLLAAGGIFFRVMKGMEKPAEYETRPTVSAEVPQTGDIVLYTDLTGTVEPQSRAAVMPKIGGEVLEVYFQAGDQVQAGQALLKIDSDALTSLKLQMESAKVAADEAAREYGRIEPLYAGGYASQQSMEQARDGAESARLAYEAAKHQYDLQLEYTSVTAPISGTVETRNVEPHDHVSTGTEVCVISAGDRVQVEFGITEKTRSNLAAGDTVGESVHRAVRREGGGGPGGRPDERHQGQADRGDRPGPGRDDGAGGRGELRGGPAVCVLL